MFVMKIYYDVFGGSQLGLVNQQLILNVLQGDYMRRDDPG